VNLTPELLLSAYCQGLFPMASDRHSDEIAWYSPDPRAVQPFLDDDDSGRFHVRRSLAKQIRKNAFEITTDRCFAKVIHSCATLPRRDGDDTWINSTLESLYFQLHGNGFAHSVEAWQAGELVGGIYGVAIGAAFFGESMFSTRPFASQLCYVWLIEHLRDRGYRLFDVQFVNPHLAQFGVIELAREAYLAQLDEAIDLPVTWADAAE
jgi:leucyl/phenylalanyl-tRNA--protein transferase